MRYQNEEKTNCMGKQNIMKVFQIIAFIKHISRLTVTCENVCGELHKLYPFFTFKPY